MIEAGISAQRREGSARIRKSGKRLVYEESWKAFYYDPTGQLQRDQVITAAGVPRVGLTRSGNGFTVCSSVDAERDAGNVKLWHVSIEYSSDVEEDTSGANESTSGDPTTWVPIASATFETYQWYSVEDASGNAFANSAGVPFTSSLPLPRTLIRYDFEQFEPPSTTLDEISARNETVNSTTFLKKPQKTMRLTVKDATIGYYYGYKVWRVAYSLLFKKDDWKHKVYDIGPFYLDGATKKVFKTDPPLEQTYFGFLTGSGGLSASPTLKEFDIYSTLDFSSFLRVRDDGYA